MPTTVREQIIAAFTARIDSLSPSGANRVLRSDDDPGNMSVSVWDGEEEVTETDFNEETMEFPIAIDLQWDADAVNPSTSASEKIGLVRQTVESADQTFGGLAGGLRYQSAAPSYPVDGSGLTSLTVIYVISYTLKIGDPYTPA